MNNGENNCSYIIIFVLRKIKETFSFNSIYPVDKFKYTLSLGLEGLSLSLKKLQKKIYYTVCLCKHSS